MKESKIYSYFACIAGVIAGIFVSISLGLGQTDEQKTPFPPDRFEQANERHHIAYQFSQKICECSMEIFLKGMTGDERQFGKVGPVGAKIVESILAVEGVMAIFIDPHEIRVFKAEAIEWEPIDSQIKKIIQEVIEPPATITKDPQGSFFF